MGYFDSTHANVTMEGKRRAQGEIMCCIVNEHVMKSHNSWETRQGRMDCANVTSAERDNREMEGAHMSLTESSRNTIHLIYLVMLILHVISILPLFY